MIFSIYKLYFNKQIKCGRINLCWRYLKGLSNLPNRAINYTNIPSIVCTHSFYTIVYTLVASVRFVKGYLLTTDAPLTLAWYCLLLARSANSFPCWTSVVLTFLLPFHLLGTSFSGGKTGFALPVGLRRSISAKQDDIGRPGHSTRTNSRLSLQTPGCSSRHLAMLPYKTTSPYIFHSASGRRDAGEPHAHLGLWQHWPE